MAATSRDPLLAKLTPKARAAIQTAVERAGGRTHPTEAEQRAFADEVAARLARMPVMPPGPERERLLALVAEADLEGPWHTSEEILAMLEARRPSAAE